MPVRSGRDDDAGVSSEVLGGAMREQEGVRAESQPAESKVKQNGDVKVKRDEASTATKRARCVHTSNGGEVSSPRARRTPTG